jgi:hypothetical protein
MTIFRATTDIFSFFKHNVSTTESVSITKCKEGKIPERFRNVVVQTFKTMKSTSSGVRRFGGTCRLHLQRTCFHSGFLLGLFLDPEMEAMSSSETSVDFQRTTWRYIPKESTLHSHRCENLKSYIQDDVLCTNNYICSLKLGLSF